MSFMPEWWSQGTTGNDSNGGFGTAAMFNQPVNRGDLSGLFNKFKLAELLKSYGSNNPPSDNQMMPQSNSLPNFTSYQNQQQVGPNMGQVNNPNMMSPNGQIMPNWNRTYGGY